MYVLHNHACKYHVYRASEIYAWRGQTPFVMSIAAARQRSSHVFLKNDCGYQNLPNSQIRRALVFFAQQNQWDLSNYDTFDMKSLGEDSYRDLSGIGIPVAKKCKALARDSLSLLAYVK